MNVALPDDLRPFVDGLVASGRYASAAEVVAEAVRVLKALEGLQQARSASLRADLEAGLADIAAGRVQNFDHALVEDIKSSGRQRLTARGSDFGD